MELSLPGLKPLLRQKLLEMGQEGNLPDVITFAGNGEPTMHPDFDGIIDDDRFADFTRQVEHMILANTFAFTLLEKDLKVLVALSQKSGNRQQIPLY